MLSVAPERPVDPLAIEILKQVDRVAQELALEYFVTGATARDILLNGVFGLDTGRGTKDVDLAIAIDGWPQFEAVTVAFVPLGRTDLEQILCHEEERVVALDTTVRLDGVVLQLDKQRGRRSCAGLRVQIRRHLEGHHSVWWGTRCPGQYSPGRQPAPGVTETPGST